MDGTVPSREVLDERFDPLCENPQGENGWLVSYPGGGLIQKYFLGDVAVAWRRAEAPGGETAKDGFIIQLLNPGIHSGDVNADHGSRDKGLHREKSFVFPQYVEAMNGVEVMVPSLVRLCSFDRGCFDGGNPLFVFEHLHGSQKLDGGLSYGEVGLAVRFYAVAREDGGHEDIEGSPGGIDRGAHVTIDERIERHAGIDHNNLPIGIGRIRLYDNFVWAAPLPSDKAILQDWDMGLGPFDSGVGA